jgi:hypothetical protein
MADTPQNPNHSLDRRREERAMETMAQDGLSRFNELASSGLEVVQKQLAWQAEAARYWADTLTIAHNSMAQLASTLQRRAA